MQEDAKKAALCEMAQRIQSHADWWLFPEQDPIQGFMGTGSVFFVGDQPSRNPWPPEHPNRKGFYRLLEKLGLTNAHLTDLYKKRGDCGALRAGLPSDFQEHLSLFREEINELQPTYIIALGNLAYELLDKHVPECKPMLRRVWHFSYAVRYGKLLDYEIDIRQAVGTSRDLDISQPKVARVCVEYDDGSCDTIEPMQDGSFPLYGLTRKRPEFESPREAYTNAAIAALLFSTAFSTKRTEYSAREKKFGELIRCWVGESPPARRQRSDTQ